MTGPVDAVNGLGAVWAENFDAADPAQVRCLMCQQAPCGSPRPCPKFGSPEYFARLAQLHQR